jgi:hypothetical protein
MKVPSPPRNSIGKEKKLANKSIAKSKAAKQSKENR